MKKRTLNNLRQTKDTHYEHPYKTKGVNVKELFQLPHQYSNDADLGKAFRKLIATATEINYTKK